MLGDHYNEVATQKQVLKKPEPDWDFYMEEQKKGRLVFVTVRDKADLREVYGYITMFVRPHPHYKSVIIATNDIHYLRPDLRGTGNGKRMIEFAEEIARERGATLFILRTKKGKSEHGYIFEALGHTLTDLVYTKDLTDAQASSVG